MSLVALLLTLCTLLTNLAPRSRSSSPKCPHQRSERRSLVCPTSSVTCVMITSFGYALLIRTSCPQMVSAASAQIEASTFYFFLSRTRGNLGADERNSCGESHPDDDHRGRRSETRCGLCHRARHPDRRRGRLRGCRDYPGSRVRNTSSIALTVVVLIKRRRVGTTPRILRNTRLRSRRAEDGTTLISKKNRTHG